MTKIIVTTKDELQEIILESVKSAISEQQAQQPQPIVQTKLLSLAEAADFLKLAKQTIYGFTSRREIPFIKKGKKLYFQKADLEQWLMEGNANASQGGN